MENLYPNQLFTNSEEFLFSKSNTDKTLDEMIQICYDLHPANVFLDLDNQNVHEDINLEPKLKIEEVFTYQRTDYPKSSCFMNIPSIFKGKHSGIDGFSMNEKDFILINSQDRITINNDIQIVNLQPQDQKNECMRHYCLFTISKEKWRQSKPKNIFSNDKTCKGTSKSIHMPKFKRWGKREDIEMFKLLRTELKSKNIDEKVFLSSYIKDILDDSSQMIEDSLYSSIIEQLAIDTNWLRTPYHLLLRIYNLVMNQEFSFRDEILLRRLILSESNSDQIDIMEIASSFPGKFMETVDEKVKSIQY